MAPRKKTAMAPAPGPAGPRRSARLASRELSSEPPSVAPASPPPSAPAAPAAATSSAEKEKEKKKQQQQQKKDGSTPSAAALVVKAPSRTQRVLNDAFVLDKAILFVRETESAARHVYLNSLTKEDREAVIDAIIEQHEEMEHERNALEKQLETKSSLRRELGMQKIMDNYYEKQAEEKLRAQITQEVKAQRAEETKALETRPVTPPSPTSNTATAIVPLKASSPLEFAPAGGIMRKVFGWVASPFARKRAAEANEDQDQQQPAQKRVRIEETALTSQQNVDDSQQGEQQSRAEQTHTEERREATHEQQDEVKGHMQDYEEEQSETPHARQQKQQSEPQEPQTLQRTPHSAGPSARNHRVPTSLSTITERTEQSNITLFDNTPTRPSRAQSQRPSQLYQSTPSNMSNKRALEDIDEYEQTPVSAKPSRQDTPRRTTNNPNSMIRHSAIVRAQRQAAANTPLSERKYSWEKTAQMIRPRQPNADERLAKINKIRELEAALKQLREDEDVKDMEAHSIHRRKRVKVDDLTVIPHNRPGDSSSTFRVPDVDSDDEMEVEDITEDSTKSIFDEGEKTMQSSIMSIEPDAESTPVPLPKSSNTLNVPAVQPQQQSGAESPLYGFPIDTLPKIKKAEPQPPAFVFPTATPINTTTTTINELLFDFPSIGPKPEGYVELTAEESQDAGDMFRNGLARFLREEAQT